MFKTAAVLVVSCGALLAGCGTDPHIENEEIIANLVESGIPADDIMVVDGAVYVGRDAHVSLEASREMLQRGEGSEELAHTTNLVGTAVTRICVNPTSSFNSYVRLSQGLDLAIQNYNQLGLRITFQRGGTGCTANITAQTMAGSSGSSGFPSNGLPYGTINIGTGLQSYSVDVNEHVITHELGHAIGLRHTDYYNRSISCGGAATNEGSAGVGSIHIPGTPTTATPGGSIMNTCYPPTTNGEFTSSDRVGLSYIY